MWPFVVFKQGAGFLAEALARLLVGEGQDVAANRDIVVAVRHAIGARANRLGRAAVAEFVTRCGSSLASRHR